MGKEERPRGKSIGVEEEGEGVGRRSGRVRSQESNCEYMK